MRYCFICENYPIKKKTNVGPVCSYCYRYLMHQGLFECKPFEFKKVTKKKKSTRLKLWKISQVCEICRMPIQNYIDCSVDHIIPISKGGPLSNYKNLQLAHKSCNNLKADKLFIKNYPLYLYFRYKKYFLTC